METLVGNMKCFNPQKFNDNIVSCGRCAACKTNRINGWVVRLEKHIRYQDTAHFITLTYGEDQCTITKNGLLTLDYSHIQSFIQTLKNLQNARDYKSEIERTKGDIRKARENIRRKAGKKISYYCAGEYGGKYHRPHYHLIMFNTPVDLITSAWRTEDRKGWKSRGNIHQGNVSGASIRYCLKYISKPSRIPLFKGDDRTPEFSYMSKGIGKDYLSERIIKWHKADLLNRYYVPGNGGVKTTMPRYYADKIYTKNEKTFIQEKIEQETSQAFYKEVLLDESIIRSVLLSQQYYTKKFSINKTSQLQ